MNSKRKRRFASHTALLFLAPGLIGFAVFYIWPFIISIGYSFISKPVNGIFAGFKNYIELFQSYAYIKGLTNTAAFTCICVPLGTVLSLTAALLINKSGRHKSMFILIFLIPLVIPSGSTVFFWKILFSNDGFINSLLARLGQERINWLESDYSRIVISFIFIWKNLGYSIVLFVSGLKNIPMEFYEAAYADGASGLKGFRYITLPCLAPSTVLVLTMSVVNSFKVFKEAYLLMGNYPHDSVYMLQHFMNNMFGSLNYPRLTTATVILVIAVAALTQFLFKLERKVSHD